MKILLRILFLFFPIFLWSQENAADNKLLQLLQDEVDKNIVKINRGADLEVYYLNYRVDITTKNEMRALNDQIHSNQYQRTALLTIQIRIGADTLDNFQNTTQSATAAIAFPIDDNYASVPAILWQETQKAYQAALFDYQAMVIQNTLCALPSTYSLNFLPGPVQTYYEAPATLAPFDSYWEQYLTKLPVYSVQLPFTYLSTLTSEVNTHYFVSSHSTSLVHNTSNAWLNVAIHTPGIEPYPLQWHGTSIEELPDTETIIGEILSTSIIIEDIVKNGETVRTNTAPAIFSAEASAILIHQILGTQLQANLNQEFSLQNRIGEKILPETFSLNAYPHIPYHDNHALAGFYRYDEEGTQSEEVELVKDGVLHTLLYQRKTTIGNTYSNGHGRAQSGYQPVARQSNTILTNNTSCTSYELKQQLKEEIKKQGKPYGYFFSCIASELNDKTLSSGTIIPIEVYKVFPDDRTWVKLKNVDIVSSAQTLLDAIIASNNELTYVSGYEEGESGRIPITVASPGLLLQQVEVASREPKLCEIPKANIFSTSSNFDKGADQYLQEMDGKTLAPGTPPVDFVSVRLAKGTSYTTTASCGDTYFQQETPVHNEETFFFIGNKDRNNLHIIEPAGESTSEEKTIEQWRYKEQFAPIVGNPEKALRDFSSIARPNETQETFLLDENIISTLNHITPTLSETLTPFTHITSSHVRSQAILAEVFFKDSEKNSYTLPFSLITISPYLQAKAEDGEILKATQTYFFENTETLLSIDSLQNLLKGMAQHLHTLQEAPRITEEYIGPVIFMEEAIPELILSSLFQTEEGLISARGLTDRYGTFYEGNGLEQRLGKVVMDKKISITMQDQLTAYKKFPLAGHFSIDAQAIEPIEKFPLIIKGQLENVLSNRYLSPAARHYSSGHHRLCAKDGHIAGTIAPGVIELKGSKTTSYKKMQKLLLSMAKLKGYEYAYIVTNYSQNQTFTPTIYRISIKKGKIELVRGAVIENPTLAHWETVAAFSSETEVHNHLFLSNYPNNNHQTCSLSGTPVSAIHPNAILLNNVKISKLKHQNNINNPLNP